MQFAYCNFTSRTAKAISTRPDKCNLMKLYKFCVSYKRCCLLETENHERESERGARASQHKPEDIRSLRLHIQRPETTNSNAGSANSVQLQLRKLLSFF